MFKSSSISKLAAPHRYQPRNIFKSTPNSLPSQQPPSLHPSWYYGGVGLVTVLSAGFTNRSQTPAAQLNKPTLHPLPPHSSLQPQLAWAYAHRNASMSPPARRDADQSPPPQLNLLPKLKQFFAPLFDKLQQSISSPIPSQPAQSASPTLLGISQSTILPSLFEPGPKSAADLPSDFLGLETEFDSNDLSQVALYSQTTPLIASRLPCDYSAPPYELYETINYAARRSGEDVNHLSLDSFEGQLAKIEESAWLAIQDEIEISKIQGRGDSPDLHAHIENAYWDPTDPEWQAAMWCLFHTTSRYKYTHRHIPIERQAALLADNLQPQPPIVYDDRVYPTFEHLMTSLGFKDYARRNQFFNPLTAWSMLGIYAFVFGLYRSGSPATQHFFHRNMTLSYDNRSRPWTYITSAYTHYTTPHILMNSMAFWALAKNVGIISPLPMFQLFTLLAVGSSIASLSVTVLTAKILLRKGIIRPALLAPAVGASGGLTGLLAMSALSQPEQRIALPFVGIDVGIVSLMTGMIYLDAIGFLVQCFGKSTGISHTGHLGGYFSGILAFNYLKWAYEEEMAPGTYSYYCNWAENLLYPRPQADLSLFSLDSEVRRNRQEARILAERSQ